MGPCPQAPTSPGRLQRKGRQTETVTQLWVESVTVEHRDRRGCADSFMQKNCFGEACSRKRQPQKTGSGSHCVLNCCLLPSCARLARGSVRREQPPPTSAVGESKPETTPVLPMRGHKKSPSNSGNGGRRKTCYAHCWD